MSTSVSSFPKGGGWGVKGRGISGKQLHSPSGLGSSIGRGGGENECVGYLSHSPQPWTMARNRWIVHWHDGLLLFDSPAHSALARVRISLITIGEYVYVQKEYDPHLLHTPVPEFREIHRKSRTAKHKHQWNQHASDPEAVFLNSFHSM